MSYRMMFGVSGSDMADPVATFESVDGPLPTEGTIVFLPSGKFVSEGEGSFSYDDDGRLTVMLAVKPHKPKTGGRGRVIGLD